MSIIKQAVASCTKCGARQEITVYRSINVAESPELKAKVRDGSLFVWTCPECGAANLARYDMLYHDPDKKLMVWLLPEGVEVSEAQMQSVSLHAKAIGNYMLRRVSDVGELMEKVLIRDEGLDDAVIELCKYVTKMELAAKAGERAEAISQAHFHFYSLQKQEGQPEAITLMFPDNGQMKSVNIGYNVYEDCTGILERNPQVRPGSGFEKIDADWLATIIR